MVLTVGDSAFSQATRRAIKVGNLKQETADGCGCYFRFGGTRASSRRFLFFSSIEDAEETAWMNRQQI
jgi:hypothetical protein